MYSARASRESRNQTAAPWRSKYRDGREPAFLDENGVVDDMDGYLSYLSLEYDSVWDTRPSWCQPWTRTLTGLGIITCSSFILNSIVVTSLVTAFNFCVVVYLSFLLSKGIFRYYC